MRHRLYGGVRGSLCKEALYSIFIDPDKNNPRAKHVYSKAGFSEVGEYNPSAGAFIGSVR